MAHHIIDVEWDGVPGHEITVRDEHGSENTNATFLDQFTWQTTANHLEVAFKHGNPFWFQSISSPGPPVAVINPLHASYPYGVTVTVNGNTKTKDPIVIIDGGDLLIGDAIAAAVAIGVATALILTVLLVKKGFSKR